MYTFGGTLYIYVEMKFRESGGNINIPATFSEMNQLEAPWMDVQGAYELH